MKKPPIPKPLVNYVYLTEKCQIHGEALIMPVSMEIPEWDCGLLLKQTDKPYCETCTPRKDFVLPDAEDEFEMLCRMDNFVYIFTETLLEKIDTGEFFRDMLQKTFPGKK
jgi:hypothetical protein